MIVKIILASTLLFAYSTSQNSAFWKSHLRSESVDVRINAIQKLAELKEETTPQVISRLLTDKNSEIRYHALRALAKFPTEAVYERLSQHRKVEKDPYLKSETRRSMSAVKEVLDRNSEKAQNQPPNDSDSSN